jgi:thiol-disulfide isomerase/thioredoxin
MRSASMRDSEHVKEIVEARLPAEAERLGAPDPAAADPAAPPPPPKRRFFGPPFWTGFGFGVIGFLALLFGGLMLLGLWAKQMMKKASPGANADTILSAPPFPAPGGAADYALGLETAEGTSLDAGSLRGRTVFLNYWATWCGPCRAEMPSIQRLYDRTRDLGVVFLIVSDEKAEKITAYLKNNAFTMPVYRSTKSRPAAYETDGIPATFVLSFDGRVVFRHVGAARWDDDSTLAFLRSLPAASAARP